MNIDILIISSNFIVKLVVLVVEDDKIEVLKFKRAADVLGLTHQFIFAENGEDAIRVLESDEEALPNLILLDLNMPRFDGFEFLTMMRSKDSLRFIPTIIMTTSENEKDLKKCYELGVAGYMIKPLDYDLYTKKVSALFNYWELNEVVQSSVKLDLKK